MMRPPIEPTQLLLPLNDIAFGWNKFEGFCADFIYKLPYVKDCHRNGKSGNKQDGIDIIADIKDGRKAGFSCKQYDNFGVNDARKAVHATVYPANEYYLLLSCEASNSVRDEWCKNRSNWHVWDTYDISRKIREFPIDIARSLIITHFGNEWVKYFLGIKGLSVFISPMEYFAKLMKPNNLFTHIYSLVGRKHLLELLNIFVDSEEHSVAILSGRGGVGKTKLLHSFSEKFHDLHSNKNILFVDDGVPITAECVNDLPIGPCIVVLDDAHRCENLPILFALARQRSIKLLLSFRPYASERIRSLLISSKFDINEIRDFGTLNDLDRNEIKDLALNVLGNENAFLADQLVAVGWDSPLVIVVGGRLLVEKKVNPHLLVHREDFKAAVLDKFQEFLLGKITDRIEPKLCRNILELIAAITPVRINDLKDEAAAFLNISPSDLVNYLNILESAGILLMRGYTLRIIPDVLSDHILYGACITPDGRTGYAKKVFENLKMVCSTNILNNLAELDWRARRSGDTSIDLFADIWSSIINDFQNSSNLGRWKLLNKLGNVAYLQPSRILSMVEYAIRNPSNIIDNSEIIKYAHSDVIQKLPGILENIGHNVDYLPRCCDLLWQIGSDDKRNLNQSPNHPIRILKDLAGYDVNKPYIFSEIILNRITAWLKEPNVHNHFHSIFDILEPLFAKSGQPAHQDNTKIKLKAIKCLEHAIMDPICYKGLEISEETLKQWIPDQKQVLDILERLANCADDPLVHMEIINAISWQACNGRSREIKEKAQGIIASIKKNFEFCLTRVLTNSYLHQKHYARHMDHRKWMEWIEEKNYDLAKKFLEKYPDPYLGFANLNQRLQIIKDGGFEPQPEQFLTRFPYINLGYAISLCELIIENPSCSIAPYFHNILYRIRYKEISRSSDLALRAINTDHVILCRSVAYVYTIWTECPLFQCDFENIIKLLAHPDDVIKMNAIRSLGVMAHRERKIGIGMAFRAFICEENQQPQNPLMTLTLFFNMRKISIDSLNILALSEKRLGIDIALEVNIEDKTELADILCSIFDEVRGIPIGDLTDKQLNYLVKKLEPIKDIDRHHICEMLKKASKRIPHSVVNLLLSRIKICQNCPNDEFLPVPYMGFHENIFKDINDCLIYKEMVEALLNFALENRNNFWISILFNEVSANFQDMCLEILNKWVSTDDADKIMSVGDLLSHSSSDFIFIQQDFISNILDHSFYIGDECYHYIENKLLNIATNRVFHRVRGEPSPEDIDLRDKASEALKHFNAGSPAYDYYYSVRKRAESSIINNCKIDEELQD